MRDAEVVRVISMTHELYCVDLPSALKENSSEVVQPFLMGCGTKEPKITQLCLAAIQRLMSHEVVSEVRKHTQFNQEAQLCIQLKH